MGAEYGAWAQSPAGLRRRPAVVCDNDDVTDSCVDHEQSWRTENMDNTHYDRVYHLSEPVASEERGIRRIIRKHDALNNTPWSSNRWVYQLQLLVLLTEDKLHYLFFSLHKDS